MRHFSPAMYAYQMIFASITAPMTALTVSRNRWPGRLNWQRVSALMDTRIPLRTRRVYPVKKTFTVMMVFSTIAPVIAGRSISSFKMSRQIASAYQALSTMQGSVSSVMRGVTAPGTTLPIPVHRILFRPLALQNSMTVSVRWASSPSDSPLWLAKHAQLDILGKISLAICHVSSVVCVLQPRIRCMKKSRVRRLIMLSVMLVIRVCWVSVTFTQHVRINRTLSVIPVPTAHMTRNGGDMTV